MTDRTAESSGSQEFANISVRERRVRMWLGYATLVIAMVLAVLFLAGDIDRWWRLVLLIPSYQGIRFLYDSRTGTCPLKAELGQENLIGVLTTIGGKITDSARADQIRRISRGAIAKSALGAGLFTLVILLIP